MVTNKNYRQFLDHSIIDTISEDQIKIALNNVTGKHTREGRALLITLYYTGARPNEVLNLKGKDVSKQESYIVFKMPGSKGGKTRPIYIPYRRELIRTVYNYSMGVFPDMYLFYNFRSKYTRYKNGVESNEVSNNLRYYFKKWFTGVIEGSIPPYFLRHNRFSNMAERGVSMEEILFYKGGLSMACVNKYVHLSTKTAKNIAKKIF